MKPALIFSAPSCGPALTLNWCSKASVSTKKRSKERIRQRFERAGLDPDRLTLLGWIEGESITSSYTVTWM